MAFLVNNGWVYKVFYNNKTNNIPTSYSRCTILFLFKINIYVRTPFSPEGGKVSEKNTINCRIVILFTIVPHITSQKRQSFLFFELNNPSP